MYHLNELSGIYDNQQLLIILLCRLYFNKASGEEVEDFLQHHPVDREKLVHLTGLHGISSFIYHVIEKHNVSLDPAIVCNLKEQYLVNQVKSAEQARISSKLQVSLLDKKITIIPYKGIGFSHNYYGNIGLRESSDMDFLVDEKDAEAIEQHMIDEGFRPKTTVPPAYRRYYRRNFKDISYSAPAYSKRSGYSAEMHWRFLNAHYGNYVTYDFFKDHVVTYRINDLPFLSLEPHYDLVAVVSNHFVKDLSTRFKYIIDIACLLYTKGDKIDAAAFKDVTRKFGFEKAVEHGLFLVEALLGQEIPGYQKRYSFSRENLNHTLEYKLIKIKISSLDFLKRALPLQDNGFAKLRFVFRCAYYYTLPMASDIPSHTNYPIPLLVLRRMYRTTGKMFQRFFGIPQARSTHI